MRVLGILQRNLSSCSRAVKERSYLSSVRPIVEYATVAWSPHTKKGINGIESVQRRAARFINNDYSRYSSVSSMLTDFNWLSLQSRRRICDLGMFYKIHRGQVNISFPYDLISVPSMTVQGPVTTLRSGSHPLQLTQSPYGTRCQLTLLVLRRTQNSSEECLLI